MNINNHLQVYTAYGIAGSSARVRVFDWVKHLAIDYEANTYLDLPANSLADIALRIPQTLRAEARLLGQSWRKNLGNVFVSRSVSPFSRGGLEASLLRNAERSTYDFDDALFTDGERVIDRLRPSSKIWERSVKSADVVIAGNTYLAERAALLHSDVRVVPSCVAPDQYLVKDDYQRRGAPVAVWLGSPSTEKYLLQIKDSLLSVNRSHGLRVLLISAGDADLGELGRMVDRVEWTLAGYREALRRADFGIMPLADDAYTRGKCGYKLLQYAASGLPLIGSAVGANKEILNVLGGLAVVDGRWQPVLQEFLDTSVNERAAMGAKAVRQVKEAYSFDAWEKRWADAAGL